MYITQLIDEKNNPALNHFVITTDDGRKVLQSYDSLVCSVDSDGKVILGEDHNYSKTTAKHVKIFLNLFGIDYYTIRKIIIPSKITL